jgi:hypothetical protein
MNAFMFHTKYESLLSGLYLFAASEIECKIYRGISQQVKLIIYASSANKIQVAMKVDQLNAS